MAKKKSSAKQTKKTSPVKAKTAAKKSAKKAPAKKKVAVKKATKKAAPKAIKKATGKTSAKAATKAKTSSKKAMAGKTAGVTKSATKKSAKPPVKQSVKPTPKAASKKTVQIQSAVKVSSTKALDLSSFVTPLDDRLIVQLSGSDKMTAGGLYIPDTVSDVSGNLQGTVVAVGRGHVTKKGHLRPMDVKLGDKVVFAEYAGSKVKIQNQDLVILREGDVMGVVSK